MEVCFYEAVQKKQAMPTAGLVVVWHDGEQYCPGKNRAQPLEFLMFDEVAFEQREILDKLKSIFR